MGVVIIGGTVLVGLAYAEKKGWVDKETTSLVVHLGMSAGIGVSLLILFDELKKLLM